MLSVTSRYSQTTIKSLSVLTSAKLTFQGSRTQAHAKRFLCDQSIVSQYDDHKTSMDRILKDSLGDPKRFQAIEDRMEFSDLSADTIKRYCKARYLTRYRGCYLLKSSEDILIYQQFFETIKPRTVLELGSYSGASGLWIADYLTCLTNNNNNGPSSPSGCQVYSMDIDSSLLDDAVIKMKPKNLQFIQGDCNADLASVFTPDLLSNLARPIVLIDDVHVNTRGILDYFHPYLQAGDYIIMEDTHPALPAKMGAGAYAEYTYCCHPKASITKQFMRDHTDTYAIDSFFEDMLGYRYTWNTWIRKMKSPG